MASTVVSGKRPAGPAEASGSGAGDDGERQAKRSRWGQQAPAGGGENGGGAAPGAPPARPAAASATPKVGLSLEALQKAKRALKMQKQISEKLKGLKQKGLLSAIPAAGAAPKRASKPLVLRLDSEGREIDESGRVIARDAPAEARADAGAGGRRGAGPSSRADAGPADDLFVDPRMPKGKGAARKKRATFDFVREGKFQKLAQRGRMASRFEDRDGPRAGGRRDRGLPEASGNANLVPLGVREADVGASASTSVAQAKDAAIPSIEWWDAAIVVDGRYDPAMANIATDKITSYVEHPVPIAPPDEGPALPPQALRLTKREQKKMRTQQRQAREKEKQEMIRQGLLEPPKPKVKISNLVRVLGADATLDPTKIETEVRRQMEEREQAHRDRNLARKLTPAERRDKKLRKMFDPEGGLFLAVFKLTHLENPQHKFKVDINAEENMLTGCVVTGDTFALCVIEGCAKSLKRYKKLMLKRIDWQAWLPGEVPPPGLATNACKLLWEGSVPSSHFRKFRQEPRKTNAGARKFLADFGLENLWDLAEKDEAIETAEREREHGA